MKALKSISYLLLAVLFGCNKKFDHSIPADNTPTSCKLCNYADNISGQYRGYASSEFNNYHDSVTVSIEHIFLNIGTKSDSTTMYFRRVKDFDVQPTRIDTILIQTSNGNFAPVAMEISGELMFIHETLPYHYGPVIVMDFIGTKLP